MSIPVRIPPGARLKYGNKKVVVNGERFDSRREFVRYQELDLLRQAGVITGLRRQVRFELVPRVVLAGKTKPAVCYWADFTYLVPGSSDPAVLVVEDAKNPYLRMESVYRLKKHLLKHVHGLEISEV